MENNRIADLLRQILDATTNAGGTGVWGGITGTLSNQTDLQTALDLKEDDVNKVVDFTTVNNTVFPTTQAVEDRLCTFVATSGAWSKRLDGNYQIGTYASPDTATSIALVTTNAKKGAKTLIISSAASFALTGFTLINVGINTYQANKINFISINCIDSTTAEYLIYPPIVAPVNLFQWRALVRDDMFPNVARTLSSQAINSGTMTGVTVYGRQGVQALRTNALSNGGNAYRIQVQTYLGDYDKYVEFSFMIPILSTSGERFEFAGGIRDFDTTAGGTSRTVEIVYSDNLTTTNCFEIRVRNNTASPTITNTSLLAAANKWYRCRIQVGTGATTASVYIWDDDTPFSYTQLYANTNVTGIPTGSTRESGQGLFINKSVGTTSRDVYIDDYTHVVNY